MKRDCCCNINLNLFVKTPHIVLIIIISPMIAQKHTFYLVAIVIYQHNLLKLCEGLLISPWKKIRKLLICSTKLGREVESKNRI